MRASIPGRGRWGWAAAAAAAAELRAVDGDESAASRFHQLTFSVGSAETTALEI